MLTRREWLNAACAGAVWLTAPARAADEAPPRPYGPRAPWNIPVDQLPRHPQSAQQVERLWRDEKGARSTKVQITVDTYTFPVYDARSATGPTPIKVLNDTNLVGKLPWNVAWKPAPGLDAQLIVLDPDNGLEWNLHQVQYRLQTLQAGRAYLVPGDYRTREDGFPPTRGAGIPYLAMLVRPQELAAGKIEHALSMTISNISGLEYVAPATKLEFPRGNRAGVPAGTRFALDLTDAELDRWESRLPKRVPDDARRAARIIAQALRDYGWFITDTSPGVLLQFESRLTAEKEWNKLGLKSFKAGDAEYPRDLLEGLFQPERCYAVVPSDQYPEELRARKTVLPGGK